MLPRNELPANHVLLGNPAFAGFRCLFANWRDLQPLPDVIDLHILQDAVDRAGPARAERARLHQLRQRRWRVGVQRTHPVHTLSLHNERPKENDASRLQPSLQAEGETTFSNSWPRSSTRTRPFLASS